MWFEANAISNDCSATDRHERVGWKAPQQSDSIRPGGVLDMQFRRRAAAPVVDLRPACEP